MFIKGHLNFKILSHSLEYLNQNLSVFGVSGLPWSPLNPREHFGQPVEATVRVPTEHPLVLKTRALITREQTLYAEHMGLRFLFDEEQRVKLGAHIASHGFYPTDYVRKYPRIPADARIPTFPLRVLVLTETSPGVESIPLIFDVTNLSPNGILLSTENQMALSILPGQRLKMVLEPRGWFPVHVKVHGLVCRVTDDMNPVSGNLTRHLGVKFAKVDDSNKTAFLDLLKDILEKIKTLNPDHPEI